MVLSRLNFQKSRLHNTQITWPSNLILIKRVLIRPYRKPKKDLYFGLLVNY